MLIRRHSAILQDLMETLPKGAEIGIGALPLLYALQEAAQNGLASRRKTA